MPGICQSTTIKGKHDLCSDRRAFELIGQICHVLDGCLLERVGGLIVGNNKIGQHLLVIVVWKLQDNCIQAFLHDIDEGLRPRFQCTLVGVIPGGLDFLQSCHRLAAISNLDQAVRGPYPLTIMLQKPHLGKQATVEVTVFQEAFDLLRCLFMEIFIVIKESSYMSIYVHTRPYTSILYVD